jgi:hypothetical protein
VCFIRDHLGEVYTESVNLFGCPDDFSGTNCNTVMAGFALILVDYYVVGFPAL